MKNLHSVSFVLLIVGGLNWLLVGLFQWGIGDIFGDSSWISRIIYILVGLSAIYEITAHKRLCRMCNPMGSSNPTGSSMPSM
jgi:uncharacterized membrane protein YuzA (DUF378 family)